LQIGLSFCFIFCELEKKAALRVGLLWRGAPSGGFLNGQPPRTAGIYYDAERHPAAS